MTRPTVTTLAESLYERLGPLTDGDAERGWPLLAFCDALVAPFLQMDEVISDRDDGTEGWRVALDPDLVPAWALGWAAQFHGITLRPGLTDAEQREWVRTGWGVNRGTVASIRASVQTTLTGTRAVQIYEREGGAYRLLVTTRTSETPDPAATEAALRAALPAGLVVTFETRPGQDYEKPAGWTYGDSLAAWPTYQQRKDAA